MLIKSDNFLHIESIIWQPLFKCVDECKGCYLKNSIVSQYDGGIKRDILDLVYEEKKIGCDQFTLSLDSLYYKNQEVIDLLKEIWRRYEETTEPLPDLCITVQNINSLNRYMNWMNLTLEKFLKPLSILSLSVMPVQGKKCFSLKEACQKTETLLNFNKCVKEDLTNNKAFSIGCRYADQVYLVLEKKPLGGPMKSEAVYWLEQAREIAKKKCKEVYIDHCLTDSRKKNLSGYLCSAGISKITVWPNGYATGCPYDTNIIMGTFTLQTGLFTQIQEVINYQELHPMKHCQIPKQLQVSSNILAKTHQTIDTETIR